MPVIVNSHEQHPFLPSIGHRAAIESSRALRQDIRPIEIAILNLMADKQTTEKQLALWLGHSPIQVNLTFVATDSYIEKIRNGHESANTPHEHVQKFYLPFSEIKDQKFDGLIVTGVNALKDRVEDETIWPEVTNLFEWSKTHVLSSLLLCWGAKAALKYFHDIDSVKGERKTFGVFDHELREDKTGVLFGFPDRFPAPVSRWKNPRRDQIEAAQGLDILADSVESGPNILAEPRAYDEGRAYYPLRLYLLNHPEYDTQTLGNEYRRDSANCPTCPPPAHYFENDDPSAPPLNTWRHTAALYRNWVNLIYAATPYELEKVPMPWRE
ncbi:MAG: homoserine O-succinyltransferase [Bdellovibrionales bacterium]